VKSIKLECTICGKTKVFTGLDAAEIIRKIDAAEWIDHPGKIHGNCRSHCKECVESQSSNEQED